MASSKYVSTKETTHAARLSRLLVDPCTDLFRDLLRNQITEVQFPLILQNKRSLLSPILNKAQRDFLYPQIGSFQGTYAGFDLSLLYVLLRNISRIPPHRKGWAKTPHPSDRSTSANIDRIREIRNVYCGHAASVSLSDPKFHAIWHELGIIIGELESGIPGGCTTYTDAVKFLKTETMDPEQEKLYLDAIDSQTKALDDLMDRQQEQVTCLKELKDTQHEQEKRITGIESEHKELEKKFESSKQHLTQEGINILENTEAVLLAHKSRPVYTKTSAVEATIEKLKDGHVAILTGKGGTGKTTTAYQVMCEMCDEACESPYIPVLVRYPEEWNKAINPNHRYVVYIDDFLGFTNLDVGAVEKWKNQLDVIFSCAKTGNVVTMLGMRKNVLEDARKFCVHEILQEEKCIDFSSEYSMTEEEKESMLRAFEEHYTFKASDLSGDNFTEFARKNGEDATYTFTNHDRRVMMSADPYYGFPLTCFQFFSRREFFQLGTSYFKHPNEKLHSAIESMRKSKVLSEKMKYGILTYVFLLGNIDTKNLQEDVFKDVFEKIRISEDVNDADISDAIEDLVGVYLSETTKTDVYKFSHETVLESVLISFGKLAPEIVIKQCRKWQLDELMRTQNYEPKPGEVVLKIPRRYYGELAQKLLQGEDPSQNLLQASDDVMIRHKMVAMDILRHPLAGDVEFVSVLLGCDASEQMPIILSELWKTLRYSDKEDERQNILLCELLDRYGPHTDPGIRVTHVSSHGNVETMEPQSEEPGTSTQPSGAFGFMTQMLSMLFTTSQIQTPPTVPVEQVPVEAPQKPMFIISREELKQFLFLNFTNRTGKCYLLSIMRYFKKFSCLHYLITDDGVAPLGLSLLHCCVLHGWEDMVDLILEFHTPTKTKWKLWSCSHLAAYAGRLSLLEKFVRLGQDLTERTGDGYSLLQTAILGLRCGPGSVFYPSSSADTGFQFQLLLAFPELADFTKMITFLLQSGEYIDRDVAEPVDNFGNNIVHYLTIHNYKDILELFLDLNKDIVFHRGNSELPTTLHVAVYLGRPEMMKALWEAGVRPRDSDLSLLDTLDSGEKMCDKRVAYTIFEKDSGENKNDDFAAVMANLERWETSVDDAETILKAEKLNSEVIAILDSMKDLSKQLYDKHFERNEQNRTTDNLEDAPTVCWNDGETEIHGIKLKTIKNLSVTFGSIDDFKQISDSLKSARN